jgi:hypothetical protein
VLVSRYVQSSEEEMRNKCVVWPQESRFVHTAHMQLKIGSTTLTPQYPTAPTWTMNAVLHADAVAIQGAMSVCWVAGAVCMQ